MSYHYEFDGPSRTLLSAIVGRIDDCELEELYFGIRRLKYKDNALTCILDLTRVTDFDVRSETIRDWHTCLQYSRIPRCAQLLRRPTFYSEWRACSR